MFADADILAKCKETYWNAKYAGKEGAGTHRNSGDSGRVHALYWEWVTEAKKRGLDWQFAR